MCKAFSCIVMKEKKAGKIQVLWKLNLDSHEKILSEFGISDSNDTKQFVRYEVSPQNNNYLKPNKWVFKVDEQNIPDWFSLLHKVSIMKAFKKFKKELYKIVIRKKIVHPFKLKEVKRITIEHKLLLKEWDSVWGSVRDSVGDSVWGSVWDSVRDSVGDSVRDSVGDSVGDSVWGYTGSFFKLKKWKNIEHKEGEYPFQSTVDLWEQGLVPSFDGKTWRLHTGKKAKIVFEITQEELRKMKVKKE